MTTVSITETLMNGMEVIAKYEMLISPDRPSHWKQVQLPLPYDKPTCFRDLMQMWPVPKVQTLAEDVGTNIYRVEKWYQRNSVPPEMWRKLLRAAEKRRLPITYELLVELRSSTRFFGNRI